ncbi:glycosyltransferase family 9 protein [Salidesulfovibrio onnuriiensis]|uniref:glycosyltransferase family 9 protein n=1 Tax=Salidesulfovibrio onnuriiensis TaxID=2583823 RepID=UPI0032B7CC99
MVFIPWTGLEHLERHEYELLINLSIRPEAAELAARLRAGDKIGPLLRDDGSQHIRGDWQLYRAGLVHNNRYNRFHWADLNALDVIPLSRMAGTTFEEPRTLADVNKVGLFLGASEAAKRPEPSFWAGLMRELLGRGLRPVLFGGPAEVELGREVERLFNGPALNLCGRLGLDEFGAVGQTLSLFITPDTGPMHLAAWTGLKCLNLSMGNVAPWETGPYPPGHYVLRADMDCARGCWACSRERLECHAPFEPKRVAALAARLAAGDGPDKLGKLRLPGLALYRTGSSLDGLYHLHALGAAEADEEWALERFWTAWFGERFGLWDAARIQAAWTDVRTVAPEAAREMLVHVPVMSRQFGHGLRTGSLLEESFWAESPVRLKPLTGFAHMYLQNNGYSRPAWAEVMSMLERLAALGA